MTMAKECDKKRAVRLIMWSSCTIAASNATTDKKYQQLDIILKN